MIERNYVTVDLSNLPTTIGPRPTAKMIASVKEYGVIVPIIVTLDGSGKYLTLDGNRRVAAMRACGHVQAHMDAVVVHTRDPELITLIANELRTENYATETDAIGKLMAKGMSDKAITAHSGMPGVSIDKRRRYGDVIPELADRFNSGDISASTMDQISRCNLDEQILLAAIMSGKGRLSTTDIKASQEALRAPLAIATDADEQSIYPEASEVTYAQLTRTINDLAERAKASGFSASQLIDLVNSAPAFAPAFEEVVF